MRCDEETRRFGRNNHEGPSTRQQGRKGMAEPVRLAMLGCGDMAGAHRKGYEALWKADRREFEIVATCDIDRKRAEAMADAVAQFQGKRPRVWEEAGAMLAGSPEVEAVDIVTVHRAHHTLAIACLEAG